MPIKPSQEPEPENYQRNMEFLKRVLANNAKELQAMQAGKRAVPVYQLDPEAEQALGKKSPELVWLQVQTMVQQAIDLEYAEAEDMRLTENYPVSLFNLMEVLGIMDPTRGVNHLLYANPTLDLQNIPKVPPLTVLKAVLAFLLDSDRYAALEP